MAGLVAFYGSMAFVGTPPEAERLPLLARVPCPDTRTRSHRHCDFLLKFGLGSATFAASAARSGVRPPSERAALFVRCSSSWAAFFEVEAPPRTNVTRSRAAGRAAGAHEPGRLPRRAD